RIWLDKLHRQPRISLRSSGLLARVPGNRRNSLVKRCWCFDNMNRGMSSFPDWPGENAMKKFLVLYMAPSAQFEQMMKNATPEQQQKGMDAWMKWMNAN